MAEEDIVWRDVLSSWASRVGYDESTNTLYVSWAKGGASSYADVQPEVFEEVSKAWSVGEALKTMVIGQYPHSKVG